MDGLTIGRLAKLAGIGIETVRFYERQGLIPAPARTDSNYRIYPAEEVGRLQFIKRAKLLGFTLSEIKDLLQLQHDPHATKADIKEKTEGKIKDIRNKISELSRMLAALEHVSGSCNGHGPISECPILEALSSAEEGHCSH